MSRFGRVMVAVTALLAMVFSGAFGFTLWQLWQHPPEWNIQCTENGLHWEGMQYSCKMDLDNSGLKKLLIQRSANAET